MVDSVAASQAGAASGAGQSLAVSGAKKALEVQEQQGESVNSLLQTSVATPKDAKGQQVDVTA